jgi:hypothetical protein
MQRVISGRVLASVRRFLQKNENQPKKPNEPGFFLKIVKICSKIETNGKKDHVKRHNTLLSTHARY